MTALTYTSKPLPGQCWAVIDSTGKTWAVCDRPQDAERVAYCMTVVAESEETNPDGDDYADRAEWKARI